MQARRQTHDEGFTLVEVVVSLTIMAIGIVGVIGVMTSSFGVATQTNGRSRAVAIATRELERLRAIPYAQLNVDATVVQWTEQVEGTTFSMERAVTWVAKGTVTRAYKQGTVAVSWTDPAGTHTVDQSSLYYPGGLGPAASTTTTAACSGTPAKPLNLTATTPPSPTGDTAIDLAWQADASSTVPVTRWTVERSTDGFATKQQITSTHPGSSTELRVDGLAVATSYAFRVAASTSCGVLSAWSDIATASTAAGTPSTCELGTANVTPARVKLTNNGASALLSPAPVVTVNTVGACAGLTVQYIYKAGVPGRIQVLAGTGGILQATLDPSGPWDVGVHSLDLYESTVKKGSLLLTVCAHNASVCT